MVCSLVGLLILIPINYYCEDGPPPPTRYHSMDSFTISNIGNGSNRSENFLLSSLNLLTEIINKFEISNEFHFHFPSVSCTNIH